MQVHTCITCAIFIKASNHFFNKYAYIKKILVANKMTYKSVNHS